MINNEEFRSYLFSRLSMNSEVIGVMGMKIILLLANL